MLEKFDTLFEQIYYATTTKGSPVAYTLPNSLTKEDCLELTSYLESNLIIVQNIRNFLEKHPKPSTDHPGWVRLWNKIITDAYKTEQLTNIVQYQDDPNNPGHKILTPDSRQKCQALRDYVLNRFAGGLLSDVNLPMGKTDKSDSSLQEYDRWLSKTPPDKHLSYSAWASKTYKI